MSLALATKLVFESGEGGFAIFSVQTLKCCYRVCVDDEGCARVQGPGVDYEADTNALDALGWTKEGQAAFAVLQFEEEE